MKPDNLYLNSSERDVINQKNATETISVAVLIYKIPQL
jgi:hypothetical protein